MHPGAFEARANRHLASGLDNTGGSTQALCVEFEIMHAMSVGLEIVEATASFLRAGYLASDGVEQNLEFSGVEFFLPALHPSRSPWGGGAVKSFPEIAQVLLGMETIDDLDGLGKLLFGDIPNPRSAITEHDLTWRLSEAAAHGLALDALGERGRLGSGVGGSSTF